MKKILLGLLLIGSMTFGKYESDFGIVKHVFKESKPKQEPVRVYILNKVELYVFEGYKDRNDYFAHTEKTIKDHDKSQTNIRRSKHGYSIRNKYTGLGITSVYKEGTVYVIMSDVNDQDNMAMTRFMKMNNDEGIKL